MTSFASSHKRFLIAALSLVVLAAVACSSSDGEGTARPATQPVVESGETATARPAQGTESPSSEAATATASATFEPASNRIAFTSSDGSIYTIDPDGSDRQRVTLTSPGIPGTSLAAFYAWPSWSPDGRHLIVSAFTPDIAGGFETSLLRTSATALDASPELLYRDVPGTNGIGGVPHFPVWHPDGGSVALIANVGDGLATFLVDVEDGPGPTVSNGAPVYLDWSASGSHLLVHTAERLVLHTFGPDGSRTGTEQIGTGSVSYRVPKFAPNSNDYAYIDVSDGRGNLLIGTPSESTPRTIRPSGIGNAFAWSPDGDRLAFAIGPRDGLFGELRIIDPTNGNPAIDVVIDTPVLAFWWSPDSEALLVVLPGGELENVALAVVDAANGHVNLLGLAQPSSEMGFVISFFNQYAADLQLWSPDSSRFIFSGILKDGLVDEMAGTQVQLGDPDSKVWVIDPSGADSPIPIGTGGFGTWSPE